MQYKILVACSPGAITNRLTPILQKDFTLIFAQNNQRILDRAEQNHDIKAAVLYLPDDIDIAKLLKNNFNTSHIPIIAIVTEAFNFNETLIDDFLLVSSLEKELQERLLFNIHKINYSSNPLTRLPSNNAIIQKIQQRLNQKLAVLYIDLDNFKPFNDKYGFLKGDEVIKQTAQILKTSVKKHGNTQDFIGHIGGDDFVIISKPQHAEKIALDICNSFDQTILQHYNKADQKNKKIILPDRRGNIIEYSIMSLSIAIVTNESNSFDCVAPIIQIAAELKGYAKSKPGGVVGSNFVKERRTYEKYIRNACSKVSEV